MKPRLITKNKSYQITDSAFYKVRTKKHLAKILLISVDKLDNVDSLCKQYNVFQMTGKSNKQREIQTPIGGLEILHSRIASLLCRIETPSFLHSGKKSHSNITNAKAHLGERLQLLTVDIEKFYPSTSIRKIYDFFLLGMKCSPTVSKILSRICTYNDHLPTGSRISMPLAYFSNMLMFQEMERLSKKHSIIMTVYVDDITFSGARITPFFYKLIKNIALRHKHIINDKTKFYKANQPKLVTGAIVKNNMLLVRNKHHKELYEIKELFQFTKIHNPEQLSIIRGKLLGKLYSCGVINKRFKSEANLYKE